jgi:peptidoglycan/LPS O-acetylase OafA/YrhL
MERGGARVKVTPALSAYLDFMRFTAAQLVLWSHLGQERYTMGWVGPFGGLGHEAVVVFFVLSGFIIHASTVDRGSGALDYAVARASRIYSVALPAVVFSVGLSAALAVWAPAVRQVASFREFSWADMAGSLLFWNNSWSAWREGSFWSTFLTLNVPYWSLCYEVWYYVFFGLFLFLRGSGRWVAMVLALLVAGPGIVALFPIWCLGAWLSARRGTLPRWSKGVALSVFLGSLAVVGGIDASGVDQAIKDTLHEHVPGFWRLGAAQFLVTDYVLGLAVVANIHAFGFLADPVKDFFARRRALLANLAGFSFTLYLFHRPILIASVVLMGDPPASNGVSMAAAVLVTALCWAISFATERQLPRWRRALLRLVGRSPGFKGGAAAAAASPRQR